MAQTKFDKQVEETAESLAFGIDRMLAGRNLDGVKRTDATFWRSGNRVLPKAEGRVRRRSYKAGWRRLSFRLALGTGMVETGYLSTRDLDATVQTVQELWENRETALAALETGGTGAASALTVGSAAYMVLTRERREPMRREECRASAAANAPAEADSDVAGARDELKSAEHRQAGQGEGSCPTKTPHRPA
ncbi:hypothetical protein [Streptomyces sp. x-80]|uniref:hypothetical protein n=1 Tax=Streptomyces sp. x-80 TaxID=2789282 RepID=UPI00397F0C3C